MHDTDEPPYDTLERCPFRCELHPYIPCSAGCTAQHLHRCVLCNPRLKPPMYRTGERVTYTGRNAVSSPLVVLDAHRFPSGWGYLCRSEANPNTEPTPYFERELTRSEN